MKDQSEKYREQSDTLKAIERWKENSPFLTPKVKKEIEEVLKFAEVSIDHETDEPYYEMQARDLIAYNDHDAKEAVKSSKDFTKEQIKRRNTFGNPMTYEEVKRERKQIDRTLELGFENGSKTSISPVPISAKYQLMVPSAIDVLIKSTSAAEGRSAASFALFALETGLRKLLNEGSIPEIAKTKYQSHCEKVSAFADLKALIKGYEIDNNLHFVETSTY